MSLDYVVRPLSDRSWLRPDNERAHSLFKASWSDTLERLDREINNLDGERVVIGMDVEERHLRLDGRLRADARPATSAVEVAFESKHGPLLYRCDRFIKGYWRSGSEDWQHNVRAVAMTLEALRAVDRYAATRSGEQYRGFRALPAGRGDAASGMTVTDAAEIVCRAAGVSPTRDKAYFQSTFGQSAVRGARVATHPDRHGGSTGQWNNVDNAVKTLRQAGWLPRELTV